MISGIEITRKAIRQPCITIAKNAGVDPASVVEKILSKEANYGFATLPGEYVNMMDEGITDSAKVFLFVVSSLLICNSI